MDDGVCRQTDPEVFFPTIGAAYKQSDIIRIFCNNCPVLMQCRDYAINSSEPPYGVWGGLTTTEMGFARRAANRTVGVDARLAQRGRRGAA